MFYKTIYATLVAAILAVFISSCTSQKQKLAESIQDNEKKLFNDSTKLLNQKVALDEIEAYKKYALAYSEDSVSPLYLFKAADLSHGMKKSKEALELYRQFLAKYPAHPKASVSLFLEAFIYDTDLHRTDSAKMLYKEFLEKYPSHQLAASAKALLDQLEMGLTDEQLVKMFEARQDSTAQKAR